MSMMEQQIEDMKAVIGVGQFPLLPTRITQAAPSTINVYSDGAVKKCD